MFTNERAIIVDENNHIVDYECDYYWEHLDSACEHVIAVHLKLQELSPDTFPYSYENINSFEKVRQGMLL